MKANGKDPHRQRRQGLAPFGGEKLNKMIQCFEFFKNLSTEISSFILDLWSRIFSFLPQNYIFPGNVVLVYVNTAQLKINTILGKRSRRHLFLGTEATVSETESKLGSFEHLLAVGMAEALHQAARPAAPSNPQGSTGATERNDTELPSFTQRKITACW